MTKDQLKQLERELWNAADNLRANSDLKSSEYSIPVSKRGPARSNDRSCLVMEETGRTNLKLLEEQYTTL
jgi:hypothetical protein